MVVPLPADVVLNCGGDQAAQGCNCQNHLKETIHEMPEMHHMGSE